MSPAEFSARVLDPGFALLDPKFDSPAARVMVLAIAGQESQWSQRLQRLGPARGYFQCERGGGVVQVCNGDVTRDELRGACAALDVESDVATVYAAIAYNDPLACVVARLILWSDPAPLPAVGAVADAWQCYLRNWRPGKPAPERWPLVYAEAEAVVTGRLAERPPQV